MKYRLDNIQLRESHNNALRIIADKHSLEFHESSFEHPIKGSIPNFAHVTGYYRGFGIFIGFVQLTSQMGFSVIELIFKPGSLPGNTTPIMMKRIPPKRATLSQDLEPEKTKKYFNCADINALTIEALNQLLLAGSSARMLIVDSNRIRLVPSEASKLPGTPPAGVIKNPDHLQKCIDLVYSLANSLGAKQILSPDNQFNTRIPSYAEVAGRDYPLASEKNFRMLLGAIAVAFILYHLWRKL